VLFQPFGTKKESIMRSKSPSEPASRTRPEGGVQSVSRAVGLLRLIARNSAGGARLLDLTEGSGLPRPTVHRLLRCLCTENLVQRDPTTRRYRLGVLAFELGLAAGEPHAIVARCRPILTDLARRSGDTVYLVMRSGDEVVCLDRIEGSFPIRTFTFTPGARRLIGFGSGGLALLAAQDDDEIEAIFSRIAHALKRDRRISPTLFRERVATVKRNGIAVSEGSITEGVTGVSLPVPNGHGSPYLAVAIAGISSRFPLERLTDLRRELKDAVTAVQMAVPQPNEGNGVAPVKPRETGAARVVGGSNGSAPRVLGADAR
jgi:DNA-binding IclR family transcriptional regulator